MVCKPNALFVQEYDKNRAAFVDEEHDLVDKCFRFICFRHHDHKQTMRKP